MLVRDQISVKHSQPMVSPSPNKREVILGKQGESGHQVEFDITAFEQEYGPGDCRLIALRPTEDLIYPPGQVTQVIDSGSIVDGHRTLTWNISSYDTALYGFGKVEIQYRPLVSTIDGDGNVSYYGTFDGEEKWWVASECIDDDGKVKDGFDLIRNNFKSVTFPTHVFESFTEDYDPREEEPWYDELIRKIDTVLILIEDIKGYSELLEGLTEYYKEKSGHTGEVESDEVYEYFIEQWNKLDGKLDKADLNQLRIRVNDQDYTHSLVEGDITEFEFDIEGETYTLEQNSDDGHKIHLIGSKSGEGTWITIPDNDTKVTGLSVTAVGNERSVKLTLSDGTSIGPVNLKLKGKFDQIDSNISSLGVKLDNEIARSTQKDTELANAISLVDAKQTQANVDLKNELLTDHINPLTEALEAEVLRAKGAEETLQVNIEAEETRAKAAEGVLQGNIEAEKTRAEGAESELEENKLDKKLDDANKILYTDADGVIKAGGRDLIIDDDHDPLKILYDPEKGWDLSSFRFNDIYKLMPFDDPSFDPDDPLAQQKWVMNAIATSSGDFLGNHDDTSLTPWPSDDDPDATEKKNSHCNKTMVDYCEEKGITPKNNDYAYVLTHDPVTGARSYHRCKYNAVSNKWTWEFDIENIAFTPEQQAAIDSGITEAKRIKYDDQLEGKIIWALDGTPQEASWDPVNKQWNLSNFPHIEYVSIKDRNGTTTKYNANNNYGKGGAEIDLSPYVQTSDKIKINGAFKTYDQSGHYWDLGNVGGITIPKQGYDGSGVSQRLPDILYWINPSGTQSAGRKGDLSPVDGAASNLLFFVPTYLTRMGDYPGQGSTDIGEWPEGTGDWIVMAAARNPNAGNTYQWMPVIGGESAEEEPPIKKVKIGDDTVKFLDPTTGEYIDNYPLIAPKDGSDKGLIDLGLNFAYDEDESHIKISYIHEAKA